MFLVVVYFFFCKHRNIHDLSGDSTDDSFVILGSSPTPSMELMSSSHFPTTSSPMANVSQQQSQQDGPTNNDHQQQSLAESTSSLEPFSFLSTTDMLEAEANPAPPIGNFLLGESSGYAVNASITPFVMRNSALEPSRSSAVVQENISEMVRQSGDSQIVAQSTGAAREIVREGKDAAQLLERIVGEEVVRDGGAVSVKVSFIYIYFKMYV